MLRGFDISAYQSSTAPSGADFIIVKATEGSGYTNSRYAAQIASARGKAKVVGAYHFARPEESSGASQADRFLTVAKPGPRDLLCLDLEASKLNQSKTNAWAIAFAKRLRERAPGRTLVIYMGSAYASNGTGRNLADHYDVWWYPQYPTSKATSAWPSSSSPWLPAKLTCGWDRPHIWQFSSAFRGGYDANVSTLTIDQLAGGGEPTPLEDDMPYGGQVPSRENVPNGYAECEFSFPNEFAKTVGLVCDNTYANEQYGYAAQPPALVRVTAHRKGRKGEVLKDASGNEVVKVGADDGKGWADKVVLHVKDPQNIDYITVRRFDTGKGTVGVDMS